MLKLRRKKNQNQMHQLLVVYLVNQILIQTSCLVEEEEVFSQITRQQEIIHFYNQIMFQRLKLNLMNPKIKIKNQVEEVEYLVILHLTEEVVFLVTIILHLIRAILVEEVYSINHQAPKRQKLNQMNPRIKIKNQVEKVEYLVIHHLIQDKEEQIFLAILLVAFLLEVIKHHCSPNQVLLDRIPTQEPNKNLHFLLVDLVLIITHLVTHQLIKLNKICLEVVKIKIKSNHKIMLIKVKLSKMIFSKLEEVARLCLVQIQEITCLDKVVVVSHF